MGNTYQIYLISDSTGETLDRVFLAIKAQFKNIEYDVKSYFFTRTENQVIKILEEAKKNKKICHVREQNIHFISVNFNDDDISNNSVFE